MLRWENVNELEKNGRKMCEKYYFIDLWIISLEFSSHCYFFEDL